MAQTVVVLWNEDPEGTPSPIGTCDTVVAAERWCQIEANSLAGAVQIPKLMWKRYLSRGSGPSTAHRRVSAPEYGIFEIWQIGPLSL